MSETPKATSGTETLQPAQVTAQRTTMVPAQTTAVAGEWYAQDVAAPATAAMHAGMVVDGKYRLEGLLGRGGMGHVWRCTHLHMEGEVALKILIDRLRRKEAAIERFWQEARLMGDLGHPNIVRIFDVSPATSPIPYMAMEVLPGASLREHLKKSARVEPEEALRLMDGVLSALIAAHKRGIIHRDIKPENLMFAQVRDIHTDEVRTELKVLDFGASILLDPEVGQQESEGIFGTPNYMSPEQASGRPLDHRTDLYSAAVVLYEMISGKLPHEGEGVQAIVYNIATEPAIPLAERDPGLPRAYHEFFARALAMEGDARYATAEEMRAALRGLSGELARLERHTELYLSAVPDVPSPPRLAETGPMVPFREKRPVEAATTVEDVAASATAPAAGQSAMVGGPSWAAALIAALVGGGVAAAGFGVFGGGWARAPLVGAAVALAVGAVSMLRGERASRR